MLVELKVKSLGIIDELVRSLDCGLSVITGETGAGKSLVIDAISALVDGRLDEGAIRYGAEAARLEGVFCLPADRQQGLARLLDDKGVPLDEESLVLSCEFRRQGRAVLRLNGSAVPRALLREVGHLLVDIHGQSEHLALFDRQRHLDYLDSYGHTEAERENFAALAAELSRLQAEIAALDRAQQEKARREEILGYQVAEIKRAALCEGEEEELMRQRQVIASSEKLKSLSYETCQALDGEDGVEAALGRLHRAREAMRRLVAIDPALKEALALLEEAYINIYELSRDVRTYEAGLEFDPRRLEEIDVRLEQIRSLKKKYGGSVAAVQEFLTQAEQELSSLASYAENRSALEGQLLEIESRMGQAAAGLSQTRQRVARKLVAAVKKELGELSLKQVVFEIKIDRRNDADGIPLPDGNCCAFNRNGIDEVEFMVSSNPGEPLKPLAAIASTGEVSRFTLALKVALAEADKTPVLIFDEIDIGVGGRSGEVVGQKLWRLARHHQVICITHLPQIAVYGDNQFSVQKQPEGSRTVSHLAEVKGEARLDELAVMIGGAAPGRPAAATAADLAQRARLWIASQQTTAQGS